MSLAEKSEKYPDTRVDSSSDEYEEEEDVQEEVQVQEEEGTDISDQMSMEELLAVQEKIGTKAFSKQIMKSRVGAKSKKDVKDASYKRANKNRPRELPLQRRPAPRMNFLDRENPVIKAPVHRDPRFDDLSGKLDIVAWKKNYEFVGEKRKEEIEVLKKSLKKVKNTKTKTEIKDTIQRMENQEREHEKRIKERETKKQERESIITSLKEGQAPKYTSKKDKYFAMKLSQFDQLKDEKKFDRYLQRKEMKLAKKSKM